MHTLTGTLKGWKRGLVKYQSSLYQEYEVYENTDPASTLVWGSDWNINQPQGIEVVPSPRMRGRKKSAVMQADISERMRH